MPRLPRCAGAYPYAQGQTVSRDTLLVSRSYDIVDSAGMANSHGWIGGTFVKLMELRQERGKSREELAVAAGVSYATIINFEQGKSIPRLDTARLIAKFLGVSVDDIEWGQPPDANEGQEPRTAVA